VLERVAGEGQSTDVDRVIELVLPVVDEQLFGEPAEARAAKEFSSRYSEAKSSKAVDAFQLLCRFSTYDSQAPRLIQCLESESLFLSSSSFECPDV